MKILQVNIGLEHERVMFKGNPVEITHVCNADQCYAPHDTLSCLAETRGTPSPDSGEAVVKFLDWQKQVDELYRQRGIELRQGEFEVPEALAKAAFEKGDKKPEELQPGFNLVRGSGLHIHFSLMDGWKSNGMFSNRTLIDMAVAKLDCSLGRYIRGASNYRKPGAWEAKPWGFEYRSLLWTGDPEELLRIATTARNTVLGCAWQALAMAKDLDPNFKEVVIL